MRKEKLTQNGKHLQQVQAYGERTMRLRVIFAVLWLLMLVGAINAQAAIDTPNSPSGTGTLVQDIKEILNILLQIATMVIAYLAQRSAHHASKKVDEVDRRNDRRLQEQTDTIVEETKKTADNQTATLTQTINKLI